MANSVSRYLAAHAASLSINTLRQRLAALPHWHREHGFPNPATITLVKTSLKCTQALHPAHVKRAELLQPTVVGRFATAITAARTRDDVTESLRCRRDRPLLLLGFWRGFRVDEMVVLCTERYPKQPHLSNLPRPRVVVSHHVSDSCNPFGLTSGAVALTSIGIARAIDGTQVIRGKKMHQASSQALAAKCFPNLLVSRGPEPLASTEHKHH